ncbi:MAG: PEP-CTERM sorting domain-containing protein [Phycisphaerae bacterium]|jgi:T5SS/PEP-CTERM-associated repeat protein|nr:PEP-CTERM sorting domain-containing protein [Phycisphaerae bacterium]
MLQSTTLPMRLSLSCCLAWLLVFAVLPAGVASGQDAWFSVTGSYFDGSEQQSFHFDLDGDVTSADLFSLRTYGYAGGVSAVSGIDYGAPFGFDPILHLVDSGGAPVADNDDGAGLDRDSLIDFDIVNPPLPDPLPAGDLYELRLTAWGSQFDGRNGDWAVEMVGPANRMTLRQLSVAHGTGASVVRGLSFGTSGAGASSATLEIEASELLVVQGDMIVARSGRGILNANNGRLTVNGDLTVADQTGSTGEATVTGSGATLHVAGHVSLGRRASGELTIASGAQMTTGAASVIELGDEDYVGALGTLTVVGEAGGAPSQLTTAFLFAGVKRPGVVNVEDGGSLTAAWIQLGTGGNLFASNGVLNINRRGTTASTVTAAARFVAGLDGFGSVNITGGGLLDTTAVTHDNATSLLGYGGGGAMSVSGFDFDSGNASLWRAGKVDIGASAAGIGELYIRNGGRVESSAVRLGVDGGDGTVEVDGAVGTPTLWTLQGRLDVGAGGTGALDIINGGRISMPLSGSGVTVQGSGGLESVVNVTGADSELDTGVSGLRVGGATAGQNGRVSITSQGRIVSPIVQLGYDGAPNTAEGVLEVSGTGSVLDVVDRGGPTDGNLFVGGEFFGAGGGGRLTVSGNGTVNVDGATHIYPDGTVELLGSQINTRSFSIDLGGTFRHDDGTLTVDGGSLTKEDDFLFAIAGATANDLAAVRLINGATSTMQGFIIGENARLEIRSGSTLTNPGGVYVDIGSDEGESEVVIDSATVYAKITEGPLDSTHPQPSPGINVGRTADAMPATMRVLNGGVVRPVGGLDFNLTVAPMAGTTGFLEVAGTPEKESQIIRPNFLTVGGRIAKDRFTGIIVRVPGGTGVLTVRAGGTISLGNSTRIYAFPDGTIDVDGGAIGSNPAPDGFLLNNGLVQVHNGGSFDVDWFDVGTEPGASGRVEVFDGGRVFGSSILVGSEVGALGRIEIFNGGRVDFGVLTIGDATQADQAVGIVDVNGPGSVLGSLGARIRIGSEDSNIAAATGHLTVTGGALVEASQLAVGGTLGGFQTLPGDPGGTGFLTIARDDATVRVSDSLLIGDSFITTGAEGSVTLNSGGIIETVGQAYVSIDPGGTLTIAGGTLNIGAEDRLYISSSGIFTYQFGTIRVRSDVPIDGEPNDLVHRAFGATNPTIGTVQTLIIDGDATLSEVLRVDDGTLSVGRLINPQFLRFDSGDLILTNSALTVGATGPFGDTLTVPPDKSFTATGVTVNAGAMLALQGGKVVADDILTNLTNGRIDLGGGASRVDSTTTLNNGLITGAGRMSAAFLFENQTEGEIRVGGGDLLQLAAPLHGNHGRITLLGGAIEFLPNVTGGLFTNHSDGLVTGHGAILATAGLQNNGRMTFTSGPTDVFADVTLAPGSHVEVFGASATFHDDVEHNGEFLVAAGATVSFLGDVTGSGVFNGPGLVVFENGFSPGGSPASVAFQTDIRFGALSSLVIELGGRTPGIGPAGDEDNGYDQLLAGGDVELAGTLQVTLINEFAPTVGDTFEILGFGDLDGTEFDAIELPALAYREAWDTSALYSDGEISVIGMLDGDTDVDWDVDSDDLDNLMSVFGAEGDWRTDFNEDGRVDLADFVLMRANFGAGSGLSPVAAPAVATPEPGTAVLLLLGLGAVIRRRKK